MAFDAVVTFESDKGEPTVWRGEIADQDPDDAVRRAVFRAEKPRVWQSVVVVLTKRGVS